MTGRGRRRARAVGGARLVLDCGGVIALSRDDPAARAVLTVALRRGLPVHVPAVVLAETLRGGPRDAPVNRVLNAVGDVDAVDGPLARVAGSLIGRARSAAGVVDSLVVAAAIKVGGAVILTSDPNDLSRLARDAPTVVIHCV